MEEDYYIALLEKRLSGNISPDERKVLDAWRLALPDNELTAKRIEFAWRATAPRKDTPTTDMDAVFAALEGQIATDEDTTTTQAKVVAMPTRSRWWMAAAAILLLLAAGAYLLRDNSLFIDTPVVYTELKTDKTSRTISLADGTKVRLNKNSRLNYPENFDDNQRRVLLEGEAFFDVSRREDQAFIVETQTGEIQVLGTSFNVRSFAEQADTEVFVASGKVKVTAKAGQRQVTITKNEGAIIRHTDGQVTSISQASSNAMSWFSGQLAFEQTPLRAILAQIEAQFTIRFQVKNTALLDCSLDITFEQSKVDRFINDLEIIFGATINQLSEDEYVINGGNC